MGDEIILKDDLTRFGLRRLHVMKMGEPVKVENWMSRVPLVSIHTCFTNVWVENPVGMHHLLICWKVREVIKILSRGKEQVVVMWWIDVKSGDTIRKAADEAACLFSAMFPWMPTKAALKILPNGIEDKKLDEPFQNIEFIEEPWVTKNCVAVW